MLAVYLLPVTSGSLPAVLTVLLFGVLMIVYVRTERPVLSRAMRGFVVACVLALVLSTVLDAVMIPRPTICDDAPWWAWLLLGCWGPYV